jgi:hypothetical protein
LICPSRRESTAGLLVDWRIALAALMRALSRSILRCTLATVSSTLAMLAVVYVRWARRASRDFFPNRGDGVITCPAVVGYQGYVNARAGTRHVSCSCAQETTVPRRRNCRRGRGRVWEGGGRQWRSRRALVMSLGEQRFSSRIRWLSGAPLSPSSSSGVGKELKAAVYQKPRVRDKRGYDGATVWALVDCWWGKG